ncbi:MAG TPA: hypothetical protein PKD53_18000 [Chloroflexaceae bacterium]|nr:hypothetical protein [Chloroflexaceae bacterium]
MARRTQRTPWQRPLGMLLAALLAVVMVPVFAQEAPPAEPLLPNTEPDATALLAAPLSEEEAVLAALAGYEAGAEAVEALAAIPEESMLLATRLTYLPLLPGRETPIDGGQNPTPTPDPRPERSADVAVTVRARPSILVRPGNLITYTFTLRNTGDAQASETRVTMPFNPNQVTPIATSLSSRSGDWLSELGRDRYTVTFGPLGRGAERSGQVVVRVNGGLPVRPADPVILDARARYTWRDGNTGGERRSNWAPVVVGAGSTHGDFVWVRVSPDRGPIGTTHVFFSNRFLPGERVSAWVNVNRGAGGVRALSLAGTANALGEVELRLRSTDPSPDLPRGTHQIVLAGQRSGLQGVVDFVVQ